MRKWGMGGGSGWWRGRGENKKWFGDKGHEDFLIFTSNNSISATFHYILVQKGVTFHLLFHESTLIPFNGEGRQNPI